MGVCPPEPHEPCPMGTKSVVLIGPAGLDFWHEVRCSPEFQDKQADPLDRWSKRVLNEVALLAGGHALFPSDGPPYPPFQAWAIRSGASRVSPVGLLVHQTAGLWVSFRGALAVSAALASAPPSPAPCTTCATQPCRTACPVNALSETRYNTDACHSHLDTPAGSDCMAEGCRARRACPVSQSFGRDPSQSAFHMEAFHPCPS